MYFANFTTSAAMTTLQDRCLQWQTVANHPQSTATIVQNSSRSSSDDATRFPRRSCKSRTNHRCAQTGCGRGALFWDCGRLL